MPMIDRSAFVPVDICSEPLELIEEFVCRWRLRASHRRQQA